MKEYIDLTGQKFGKLTVLRLSNIYRNSCGRIERKWLCRCDCGTEKEFFSRAFKSGDTISCGCYRKMNKPQKTHGKSKTRLYKVWHSMKQRCLYKNGKSYKSYGGRGITICPEWLGKDGFQNFYNWAYENGYDENAPYMECTLDRIDVNGNYEPSNCRWSNKYTQQNNTRNNLHWEYNGETHTPAEWSRIVGIPQRVLRHRVGINGYSIKRALTQPLRITKRTKNHEVKCCE